jgi:hypothetical protein
MSFISFTMVKYMTHNSKYLGEQNTSRIIKPFSVLCETKEPETSFTYKACKSKRKRAPYLVGFILLINFAYTSSIDEILKTTAKPRLTKTKQEPQLSVERKRENRSRVKGMTVQIRTRKLMYRAAVPTCEVVVG